MGNRSSSGATLMGLALAITTATACAPRDARPAGSQGTVAAADAEGAPAGAPVSKAGAAPVQPSKAPPPEPPKTLAECRARLPEPSATAPAREGIDAQTQLDDHFILHREAFRCCFDVLFAPKVPRVPGHVALLVKVDHTGKMTSSEILQAETDIQMPEVRECILGVAGELRYPAPVNNMDVAYKRVLDFKPRR